MREITTKVYTFDELSGRAKERARDWYRRVAPDYEWYENIYEDAERVGLEIEGFDIDRGSYVKAIFRASAEETAHKIEEEHGESCATYKTAKEYLKKRDELIDTFPADENGDRDDYALDEKLDELDKDFLHDLQDDYMVMLRNEYKWLTSDEQVDEAIEYNRYEFTEDGKRA